MERLKMMKETIMSATQGQLANLSEANCKELAEAMDMIKDLSEAIYYCTVVEAMEKDTENQKYYTPNKMMNYGEKTPYWGYNEYYRDMDKGDGVMYYTEPFNHNQPVSSNNYPMKSDMTDYRQGRSQYSRKNYMEAKEKHKPDDYKMKELEQYMKELSGDITEMIQDSSAQEKEMLKEKLMRLMEKI